MNATLRQQNARYRVAPARATGGDLAGRHQDTTVPDPDAMSWDEAQRIADEVLGDPRVRIQLTLCALSVSRRNPEHIHASMQLVDGWMARDRHGNIASAIAWALCDRQRRAEAAIRAEIDEIGAEGEVA